MIMLGNQTPEQIAQRLRITLSDEHLKELHDTWQGKWHCYDLPFMMVCSDKPTAEKWVGIFKSYDLSNAERFQISWER